MKTKMKTSICLLFSIVAFVLVTQIANCQQAPKIGDVVKDFNLPNINGKSYSLADLPDAKGYVVIFTCNTRPYAVAYEDRIIELHKNYAPQGYPVVAINPNDPKAQPKDSMEDMQMRAAEKGFEYLYLQDVGQKVHPTFGATKTPHVFLLNKENKDLKLKYIGAIDDNYKNANLVEEKFLEDAITSIIQGKEIQLTETKAIGCTIKTVSK